MIAVKGTHRFPPAPTHSLPVSNSGLSAAILIAALTRCDLAAKLRNQRGSPSISLPTHAVPPTPDGKFKYHISAECNIHLEGDKSAARVSCIRVRTDAAQSPTPDLTGRRLEENLREARFAFCACVCVCGCLRGSRFRGICTCPAAPPASSRRRHLFSFPLAF